MRVPDYLDLYQQHEAEQERWLKSRPVCCYCGEPIQDEYYFDINGEEVCPECLERHFKKQVEDYIE